jgi:hypothetical protein
MSKDPPKSLKKWPLNKIDKLKSELRHALNNNMPFFTFDGIVFLTEVAVELINTLDLSGADDE